MKNSVLFLVLLMFVGFSCRKDPKLTKTEICLGNISTASAFYFIKFANYFAYKTIQNNPDHESYNEFSLDKVTVNYYLSKLSAVYQKASGLDDELFEMINKYGFYTSTNPRVDLHAIIVKFADSNKVVSALKSNQTNTSNSFVNKMISDYQMEYETYAVSETFVQNSAIVYQSCRIKENH